MISLFHDFDLKVQMKIYSFFTPGQLSRIIIMAFPPSCASAATTLTLIVEYIGSRLIDIPCILSHRQFPSQVGKKKNIIQHVVG